MQAKNPDGSRIGTFQTTNDNQQLLNCTALNMIGPEVNGAHLYLRFEWKCGRLPTICIS